MKNKRFWIIFLCAFCFGTGLVFSGMTQPAVITGFLDFGPNWNPSLLWVMVGAVSVYAVGFRFIIKRPKPVLAEKFEVPTHQRIDRDLIIGSLIFGAGWGLAGFCPGPALVALGGRSEAALVFCLGMLLGFFFFDSYLKVTRRKASRPTLMPFTTLKLLR